MKQDEQTMKILAENMNGLMQRTVILDNKVATMARNASMDVQSPMLVSAHSFYAIAVIIKMAYR